ncbi:hypothetical protein Q8F55_002970 [Vanrija albida]|uniref:Uncharacterized protein n=1 Tax=Vanrija albida TaxID=181172 RepID=A0ABR3QC83_9TREE
MRLPTPAAARLVSARTRTAPRPAASLRSGALCCRYPPKISARPTTAPSRAFSATAPRTFTSSAPPPPARTYRFTDDDLVDTYTQRWARVDVARAPELDDAEWGQAARVTVTPIVSQVLHFCIDPGDDHVAFPSMRQRHVPVAVFPSSERVVYERAANVASYNVPAGTTGLALNLAYSHDAPWLARMLAAQVAPHVDAALGHLVLNLRPGYAPGGLTTVQGEYYRAWRRVLAHWLYDGIVTRLCAETVVTVLGLARLDPTRTIETELVDQVTELCQESYLDAIDTCERGEPPFWLELEHELDTARRDAKLREHHNLPLEHLRIWSPGQYEDEIGSEVFELTVG